MAERLAFDPFEALGLPRDASTADIKKRYHALARRYHPSRHRSDESTKTSLSHHFYNIHEAWRLLSNADSRRRRVELLKLLELQDEMLAHFMDLLHVDEHVESGHDSPHEHSDRDGHISSDADDDLPNFGLQRRQTFANRNSRATHSGDQPEVASPTSPTSPTKKHVRNLSKLLRGSHTRHEQKKGEDYFTLRRKKMEKLRKKELEAFIDYRNAMVVKFEAEEEAERQHEMYERAKWKREYFERAPRQTSERMRSLYRLTGAITAFETGATPRRRNVADGSSFGIASPVTGQGETSSQFLLPEAAMGRRPSMSHHRRNYSSDISGDQSDSEGDGEAHGGPRKAMPPGRWRHHWRGTHDNVTIDAFSSFTKKPHTGASPGGAEPAGPLKIIIRQPTDLGTIREGRDSSGETPSGSSRSPSPQPHPNGLELVRMNYTWTPTTGPAEVFGLSSHHRERSPSPDPTERHRLSLTEVKRDHGMEGCQLFTKQLGTVHHRHIPKEHVYTLNRDEKARVLGVEPDIEAGPDPELLLKRLQKLDPRVASKFTVKPDSKDNFAFRLIYDHRQIATGQHQSFIALSYRRKLHVQSTEHSFSLPLEPEMFQAVWEEKLDHEGLWIDQICIDQDSRDEMTASMSAMDMVYRSARMVVVALDDIELESYEGELLENHIGEYNAMSHVVHSQRFRHKQPPYLESHDSLFKVIRKILRSTWFRRAWCRHEMRLAKHHTFLIPCKRPGSWNGRDVLKFNGKSMSHLLDLSTEVPFEEDVESVKPALHAFFRDRSKMAADDRRMMLHHGNFSTVVAEVFAMDAGGDPRMPQAQRLSDARKDKCSIILNTMECGLALHENIRAPGVLLEDSQCFHDLILLSLAAQDPGALCSVGAPLPITNTTHSWIYMPTVADSGLNNSRQLQRLPDSARFAINTSGPEHYIQLDLKVLKGQACGTCQDCRRSYVCEELKRPRIESRALELARNFIKVCEERNWGRNRKRYLINDRKANLLFGSMGSVYEETLACVFACGPDWMSDVCRRYSMSRWKVLLQGAYELLVALANTNGNWPPSAWNPRAAGFIMDFVNFLIIRGMPQRSILRREPWRPRWVRTSSGGKVVTFAPIDNPDIQPAIPAVLLNADYVHLARLWILEPRKTASGPASADNNDWTLVGKSVLFSDELSIGQLSAYGGDFKDQQKVYGRHRILKNGVEGSNMTN